MGIQMYGNTDVWEYRRMGIQTYGNTDVCMLQGPFKKMCQFQAHYTTMLHRIRFPNQNVIKVEQTDLHLQGSFVDVWCVVMYSNSKVHACQSSMMPASMSLGFNT